MIDINLIRNSPDLVKENVRKKFQEEKLIIVDKIIKKEIPSTVIYENNEVIAFNDINPQAKTHILIVPKKHIETIKDLNEIEKDELNQSDRMRYANMIAYSLEYQERIPTRQIDFFKNEVNIK